MEVDEDLEAVEKELLRKLTKAIRAEKRYPHSVIVYATLPIEAPSKAIFISSETS